MEDPNSVHPNLHCGPDIVVIRVANNDGVSWVYAKIVKSGSEY